MSENPPAVVSLPAAWLVAGLGNPGRQYAGTRHNVGFEVADQLARLLAAGPAKRLARTTVRIASERDRQVIIARPQTYMNLSGASVSRLLGEYHIEPANLIVVHDDLDLDFGRTRLRRGGSAGGHRGVQSIIDSLRTPQFVRVRIGIGRPPAGVDPVDFVLSEFTQGEVPVIEMALERAVEAVRACIVRGLESAMNEYNRLAATTDPSSPSLSPDDMVKSDPPGGQAPRPTML